MKKNIVIGVLAAMVLVLVLLVWFQGQQIAGLKEQQQRMVELDRAIARASRAPRPAPMEETPAPVVAAKSAEPVAPVAAIPQAESGGGTSNKFFAGLAEMMKNPAMKEMVRAQQKVGLEKMYGPLSKYLSHSTNDMDALKELLSQRQTAMMDAGMSMMSGSGTDQKQAAEDAKAIKADYDKKISDLLGPQDYQVFQDYEKTASERMSVQMFKDSLPADAALSDQQEYDLITAMYEESKALPATALMNNQTADPSKLTEEGIAEALKRMEQLQARYADRAAAILTPAQLEQFTKFEQQLSAMQAAGMKMAAQMFGNKGTAPAPAANPGP